jgi:hypothetical protein
VTTLALAVATVLAAFRPEGLSDASPDSPGTVLTCRAKLVADARPNGWKPKAFEPTAEVVLSGAAGRSALLDPARCPGLLGKGRELLGVVKGKGHKAKIVGAGDLAKLSVEVRARYGADWCGSPQQDGLVSVRFGSDRAVVLYLVDRGVPEQAIVPWQPIEVTDVLTSPGATLALEGAPLGVKSVTIQSLQKPMKSKGTESELVVQATLLWSDASGKPHEVASVSGAEYGAEYREASIQGLVLTDLNGDGEPDFLIAEPCGEKLYLSGEKEPVVTATGDCSPNPC